MGRDIKSMSNSVIQRLPRYLVYIQRLKRNDIQWISSSELAEALGLTPSTVRQDLSYIELAGISKKGYKIELMESALSKVLGINHEQKIIIIGAGNLGKALAMHRGFAAYNFTIEGIFDNNPELIGLKIGMLEVKPISQLKDFIKNNFISMGVIAVPQTSAQEVANQLIEAGVCGILNLTSANLNLPPKIAIVNTRISASLLEVACFMNVAKGECYNFNIACEQSNIVLSDS
ncbi:MAG: redox-sensing transcriptional repressor Rex [Spirochaetales bacterium]|nr:redox-sensing transcriptional repressor Rex [Spirochaetales bacterium]